MGRFSSYLSIITLNVNELNSPMQSYRLAEMDEKVRSNYMLPTRHSIFLGQRLDVTEKTNMHVQMETKSRQE